MRYVVDTSVALKWVVREDGSEAAAELIGLALAAPDLIAAESANALWSKARRRDITDAQAVEALPQLLAPIILVPAAEHSARALELGLELAHPVYDCVFLAVAEELSVPLITADRRLWRTCAGTRYRSLVQPLEVEH